MTKKQLESAMQEMGETIDEMLEDMEADTKYIKDLEKENKLLKNVLEKLVGEEDLDQEPVLIENFKAPIDGKMSCGDIELNVKAGYTHKEMSALMKAGNKILKWLDKEGIKLNGKGSSENN